MLPLSVFLKSIKGDYTLSSTFFRVVLYRKKSTLIYLNARLSNDGDVHVNMLFALQAL